MKLLITAIFLFSQMATAATYRMSLDQAKPILTPGKFITVSEGTVGIERIIQMLNVKDDHLIVDQKAS